MAEHVKMFTAKSLDPPNKLGMIVHLPITQDAMKGRNQRVTGA